MKVTASTLLALLLAVPLAGATDFLAAQHYDLAGNQTITNELWLQAQTISMAGTAEDDLFLLANGSTSLATNETPAVRLAGDMQADVWAMGESILISGPVARHARLLGYKSVTVNGPVKRNLIAVGGSVVVGEKAELSGNALLAGRDVLANGTIHGKTRIYATQVTLSGQFDGDMTITATDITVMPGTHISGNLNYLMDKDLILDSKVVLGGHLIKITPQTVVRQPSSFSLGAMAWQVGLCFGALLVGITLVSFFPHLAALSTDKVKESIWRCLLVGFVSFCLIPMVSFFLIFTLVGLPLCIVLVLLYLIALYVGKIITAIYLGQVLLRGRQNAPVASALPPLLLGLLIVYAGVALPFPIDILLWFAFTLVGLGGLVGAILDRRVPGVGIASSDPAGAPPPLV
jgi:cytoskeletal protein CcmA (bactofilin family)